MADQVLLIDDDTAILRSLGAHFERSGWEVLRASTGEAGVGAYRAERPTVVVLDLNLPDRSGIEVLERLRSDGAAVVMLTGDADIESAVRAMQLGAENFLIKPIEPAQLLLATMRTAEKVRARRELDWLRGATADTHSLRRLGSSTVMRRVADEIGVMAETDKATVLIEGESGVGKGWVANLIHALSCRAHQPFVSINCAGLSPNLLSSELFGHERGAFTDAHATKQGLFEIADGGTLFLDEMGELALEVQPKLLDVLESRRFRRMGGTREISVDVRLITATNRNLKDLIAQGRFREDLYYRISVMPITLPPVRVREREDRIMLLDGFHADLSKEIPSAPDHISSAAYDRLLSYGWPGNVREMKNVLERALIMARSQKELDLEHLPLDLRHPEPGPRPYDVTRTLADVEREHIAETLRALEGNRTRAARSLGISRATLQRKIRDQRIEA